MNGLFEQKETKISHPDAYGWYNTDKGKLFYFLKEKQWSCREDKISEEYPNYWYKPALNTSAAIRMRMENLEKDLNECREQKLTDLATKQDIEDLKKLINPK